MAKNNNIKDTTLAMVSHYGDALYLEEGLVLSNAICDARSSEEPTRTNFILMALCTQGHAEYMIDTREMSVAPGDLMFISDQHIVDRYKVSEDFQCLGIMVSTLFYHGFAQNVKNVSSLLLFSMNNPVVKLTPQETEIYSKYYHTIREKMANDAHPYRIELVSAHLLAMFYDMSGVIYRVGEQAKKSQTRGDMFFSNFIKLLEANYRTERRVSWYAKQLDITPKYLSEVVKQVSKRTPTDWIDDYVVLEMRVLLKNSTKNIKEIAEELHFPNQSFLGKYFKEHVGVSPSTFRKRS